MATLPRDSALLDAIEALEVIQHRGPAWRVVRDTRSPCDCASAGGRWDDGSFDVLYTSTTREGAVAEMYFHLKRGQPVFPSQVRYRLHELDIELDATLDLSDLATIAALGVNTASYGQLSYAERADEYPRCQEVAEAAHFLGSGNDRLIQGLKVPNARWDCSNLVIFCDNAGPGSFEEVKDHGPVDWSEWERQMR
ncbi:RES family NAD+ phosphorylase [Sinisalibacter aestuarii]|uniref:RES domain-containing protein n=1 Tax=Sinisalibacter aestuarii TaxID=2949426 RepID=A0ABQ5LXV0_9RHOB|nr:hypothetical protein STA1M1_33170 [Sinisalibacter aestuarii]